MSCGGGGIGGVPFYFHEIDKAYLELNKQIDGGGYPK